MPLPIVVDIAPGPYVNAEQAALVVEACSRAVGHNGCVLFDPKQTGGAARALSVVSAAGERRVRVDVARLGSADGLVISQELEFRTEDLPADRCRAVGLAIAALVAERSGSGPSRTEQPRPVPEDASRANDADEGSRPATARGLSWLLGAGGLVGAGIQGGTARAGVWARTGLLDRRTGFFATVSTSYARATSDPAPGLAVHWWTLGGGGGLGVPLRPLNTVVRARFEGFFDLTLATVQATALAHSASGQAAAGGSLAAVELVWPAGGPVALVAAGEAFIKTRSVQLKIESAPVASTAVGGYSATLGIELRLR